MRLVDTFLSLLEHLDSVTHRTSMSCVSVVIDRDRGLYGRAEPEPFFSSRFSFSTSVVRFKFSSRAA